MPLKAAFRVKLSAVERMPPGLMAKLEELRGLDATA
jgi:hypothetical protein